MAFRRSTVRSRSAPPTPKTRRDAVLRVLFVFPRRHAESMEVHARGSSTENFVFQIQVELPSRLWSTSKSATWSNSRSEHLRCPGADGGQDPGEVRCSSVEGLPSEA